MRTTNLFIVINEETLNTLKGANNKTKKFTTETAANLFAASKLNLWTVVHINFTHEFINHQTN